MKCYEIMECLEEVSPKSFAESWDNVGLLCGRDMAAGLAGKELGEGLLIPSVTLRHETDRFLDDTTVPWLRERTGVPVRPVDNDGGQLLDAIRGIP